MSPEELARRAADEVEAALQDASSAVAEAMHEIQTQHGLADSEIRAALVAADFGGKANHCTKVGFASAWDDFQPEGSAR